MPSINEVQVSVINELSILIRHELWVKASQKSHLDANPDTMDRIIKESGEKVNKYRLIRDELEQIFSERHHESSSY